MSSQGSQQEQWQASSSSESKKIDSESGWNLPGGSNQLTSRTRGGTRAPTNNEAASCSGMEVVAITTSTSPSSSADGVVATSSESVCTPSTLTLTPSSVDNAPTRVIVEMEMLKEMWEHPTVCPKCKAALLVSFPTCCLATGLRIACSYELCDYVFIRRPASALLSVLSL